MDKSDHRWTVDLPSGIFVYELAFISVTRVHRLNPPDTRALTLYPTGDTYPTFVATSDDVGELCALLRNPLITGVCGAVYQGSLISHWDIKSNDNFTEFYIQLRRGGRKQSMSWLIGKEIDVRHINCL